MKNASRIESQNRITEAARRLEELLEVGHLSTDNVSYYRSNLTLLEREIEIARSCGDTGPYINRLLDQLQPVRDQLFECEMALLKQEQGKINHWIELTRALQELSEVLESTGIFMISSLGGQVVFTLSGFLQFLWLYFTDRKIEARYIACENYDLESLSRLVLRAKDRLGEKL